MHMIDAHHNRTRLAVLIGAAACTGALLLPSASHAQFVDETAGFYVGGGIGRADLDSPCPGGTRCDDDGIAWKVYGGYQINKWLSAELGFINLPDADFRGPGVRGDIETWGITAHAVGKFPIPIGALDRLSILGKLGAVYWDRERNANLAALDDDDSGVDFAWGLGAEYTISERVGVRAEWERFENVGDSDVGRGDVDAWTLSVNYEF
ncbi:MAG: outer membrane beta-barrel protein [Burkholderiales bacterium]|nr:outer membrane beta-barrel protein [Burkholderiales bacterium]